MSGSFTTTIRGFRWVDTQRGDTLQIVASREMRDASRWIDIALLNGLQSPYLTDDPDDVTATVLLTGARVMVPSGAPQVAIIADPASVFGADIALSKGSITVTASGDWATVSGVPNLQAAIEHALATHVGDLIWHRRYGCNIYRLLGRPGSPQRNTLGAFYASRTIAADPRIYDVGTVTAQITADQIVIAASPTAIDNKVVPVGYTRST